MKSTVDHVWGWLVAVVLTTSQFPSALAADVLPPSTSSADTTEVAARPGPLSGTGSVRLGYWAGSRDLTGTDNVLTGSIWSSGRLDLGSYGEIDGDGWGGSQVSRETQADREPGLRDETPWRLRELFWREQLGDVELRVGRQMFLWGRADGINPTDNLTPRDFLLLTPDDSDQRFGNFATQLSYGRGNYTYQAIWQPEFQTDLVPLRPTPGLTYRYQAPSSTLGQFALKLDHTGGSVDWPLSYYTGYDTRPDLAPSSVRPAGVEVAITNHRKQVLGADVSAALGNYVLRGEAAYTFGDDGNDPAAIFRKRSQFAAIGGVERRFDSNVTVNLQYFLQQVADFHDPARISDPLLRGLAIYQNILANQIRPFQHGLAYRLAYTWGNDAWTAEQSGVAGFSTRDYLLRGKVTYAVNDHWRVISGFDYLNGPQRSLFGYLSSTSTGYVELRYVF